MKSIFKARQFLPAFLAACLLALPQLLPQPAAAQSSACMDAVISNSNNSVIALRNGQKYQVFPGTGGRIAAWLPGDKVTLCRTGGSAYVITNTSRGNGTAKVLRMY